MLEKYEMIQLRYQELVETTAQAEVIADMPKWQQLMKEQSELEPKIMAYEAYLHTLRQLADTQELLQDPDWAQEAKIESEALTAQKQVQEQQLKHMLLPRDPDADRSVVMEIRQGAGGDEAALFGALLLRMYTRFAERHHMRVEPVHYNMTELGGVKEAVFTVIGKGAYEKLRFESGVHRVQRVPSTETGGRIHTSTCTVAVLPEVEDVDVQIDAKDLRIDTYRASGHGGQYINRTDSAIRITHLPSGLVVTCQDEKSQLKNKEKAMRVLKSRLYDKLREEKDSAYASLRHGQVGTGDRSERVRSYNFPQGRVTDHRANLTLYKIDSIADGDLDEIIEALQLMDENDKLRDLEA